MISLLFFFAMGHLSHFCFYQFTGQSSNHCVYVPEHVIVTLWLDFIFVFHCHVTNSLEFPCLSQHPFTAGQKTGTAWLVSVPRLSQAEMKVLDRLDSHLEALGKQTNKQKKQLPSNSNCWRNSYVYSCRTWVHWLNVSWGLLTTIEAAHLPGCMAPHLLVSSVAPNLSHATNLLF